MVNNNEEESIKNRMADINTIISQLRACTKLINKSEADPRLIHSAMANHWEIILLLQKELRIRRKFFTNIKKEYNEWWHDVFIEARDKLNIDRVKSKYASKAEIESQAIVDNKENYLAINEGMTDAEDDMWTIQNLLSSWKDQVIILNELDKGIRFEMGLLNSYPESGGLYKELVHVNDHLKFSDPKSFPSDKFIKTSSERKMREKK